MVHEVVDTDEAIRVAYEFYKKHPKETLILITADHETGGLALGNGGYNLDLRLLAAQTMSSYNYTARLKYLRRTKGDAFTWDLVRKDLEVNFGIGTKLQPTRDEVEALRQAYTDMVEGRDKGAESLYASECGLAATAKRILAKHAHVAWTTGGHTDGYVPVFAIGAGAEQFRGRIDNTEIPKSWRVCRLQAPRRTLIGRSAPQSHNRRHNLFGRHEKVPLFRTKQGDFLSKTAKFSAKVSSLGREHARRAGKEGFLKERNFKDSFFLCTFAHNYQPTNTMLIIGIAGGTGSGKTTVVRKIVESLPANAVAVIPQDSYYKHQWDVPEERRKLTNFDHPNAFDWPLLTHQIEQLRHGVAIEQPTYSYLTCTRCKETIHVEPREVIIVEGIMALYDRDLREQMDLKIFVDTCPRRAPASRHRARHRRARSPARNAD